MASLAGLAAAVTWAAASTFLAVALRRTSPPAVSAGRLVLLGAVQSLGFPALLLTGRPDPLQILAIGGSALMGGGVGDSLYTAGLRHVGQATALPLTSSLYPMATFFLAAFVFGEELSPLTAGGALLVVSGAMLVVYSQVRLPRSPATAGDRQHGRGLALVLAGTSLWVASALTVRWGVQGLNPLAAIAIRSPVSITLAVPMLFVSGPEYRSNPRRIFTRACLGAGLLAGVTSYLFLTGVRFGGVGRTTVLFSTSPLIGLAFSKRVLAEGIGLPTLTGTVAAVAGVVLLVV